MVVMMGLKRKSRDWKSIISVLPPSLHALTIHCFFFVETSSAYLIMSFVAQNLHVQYTEHVNNFVIHPFLTENVETYFKKITLMRLLSLQ